MWRSHWSIRISWDFQPTTSLESTVSTSHLRQILWLPIRDPSKIPPRNGGYFDKSTDVKIWDGHYFWATRENSQSSKLAPIWKPLFFMMYCIFLYRMGFMYYIFRTEQKICRGLFPKKTAFAADSGFIGCFFFNDRTEPIRLASLKFSIEKNPLGRTMRSTVWKRELLQLLPCNASLMECLWLTQKRWRSWLRKVVFLFKWWELGDQKRQKTQIKRSVFFFNSFFFVFFLFWVILIVGKFGRFLFNMSWLDLAGQNGKRQMLTSQPVHRKDIAKIVTFFLCKEQGSSNGCFQK